MSEKPTISLDFDGVLHSYTSGWTGDEPTDPPTPGAQDFVRTLQQHFNVVVQSARARTDEGQTHIQEWLSQHRFPELKVTSEKPHALLYVDDRGWRFEGPEDFQKILALLLTTDTLHNSWTEK